MAVEETPLPNPETSPSPAVQGNDWETVMVAGPRPSETYQVSAQRRDTLDQDLLESIPNVIPPELQRAFEQSGYRVVQQREIVPVPMQDDRRLVVPVDHIQIHYVGRRPSL